MALEGESSMKKRTHISPQDVINYNLNSASNSQSSMTGQSGISGLNEFENNGLGNSTWDSGLTSQENRNTGWSNIHSENNTIPYLHNTYNIRTSRNIKDIFSKIGSVLLIIFFVVFVVGLIIGFVQNREAIGASLGAVISNFAYALAGILIETFIIWWLINSFARLIRMEALVSKRKYQIFALIFAIFVIGKIIPELGAALGGACLLIGSIVFLIKLLID